MAIITINYYIIVIIKCNNFNRCYETTSCKIHNHNHLYAYELLLKLYSVLLLQNVTTLSVNSLFNLLQ